MAKDSYLGRLIDREFRCRAGSSGVAGANLEGGDQR